MKQDLEDIIATLERVQEHLHRGRYNTAGDLVYNAQGMVQFLKDNTDWKESIK